MDKDAGLDTHKLYCEPTKREDIVAQTFVHSGYKQQCVAWPENAIQTNVAFKHILWIDEMRFMDWSIPITPLRDEIFDK